MGFFQKLSKGANSFFHKVDSGANNAFKKIGNGIQTAGNIVDHKIINPVAGAGSQVGNFLEKNAGKIANVASMVAPEFAPEIMAAGSTAQRLGGQLKQGSSQVKQLSQMGQVRLNSGVNGFSNAISGAINQGNSTSQNMINQTKNNVNGLLNQANIH